MGKYKYNCDYCDKKFLNYKAFKKYHKLSLQHRTNVFRHYFQTNCIILVFNIILLFDSRTSKL